MVFILVTINALYMYLDSFDPNDPAFLKFYYEIDTISCGFECLTNLLLIVVIYNFSTPLSTRQDPLLKRDVSLLVFMKSRQAIMRALDGYRSDDESPSRKK